MKLFRITIKNVTHSLNLFRNVPYASYDRFGYAKDCKPWSVDLPVVNQTPHYPQPDEFNKANWKTLPRTILEEEVSYHGESEDLPLNICTPSLDACLPVVLYVHGGSLVIGGASSYDGHALAAVGGVVVVSINYRLGMAGTASFNQTDGNWCLSDVLQALKWVKENIPRFGGDPNCVTLMGYSVGGMMVDALMSSPLSEGLFHRAISMSGNFSSPWVVNSRLQYCRSEYAKICGVEVENLENHLKSLSFEEMREVEAAAWMIDYEWTELTNEQKDLRNYYFVLRTGDKIVPKNPYNQKDVFNMDVPYLMGLTNDEGGYSISYYHHPNFVAGMSHEEFIFLLAKTATNRGLLKLDDDFTEYARKVEEVFGEGLDPETTTYYSIIWGRWFGKSRE